MTLASPEGLNFSNLDAEICVIGRCDFNSGIGAMTYAACEMLSRAYPTCILPTDPSLRNGPAVFLPNGRHIPVCHNPNAIKVSLFCDVLWNGVHDRNFLLVPQDSLRIAWIVFDSDVLPAMWVDILNNRFDLLLVTSPHLLATAQRSGVDIPAACMPIPLDLAGALAASTPRRPSGLVRFGSVAAFHPRKNTAAVVDAFAAAFRKRSDVSLVLHSNLAFAGMDASLRTLIQQAGAANITLSHAALPAAEKDNLLREFDVFVNCSRGEAYSIGPREALATGCALVLSDIGGHADLRGIPGVFLIPAEIEMPARYPEIDNMVVGRQRTPTLAAIQKALVEAREFALSPAFEDTMRARRTAAAQWSFDTLATPFAALMDPALKLFRKAVRPNQDVIVPKGYERTVTRHLGSRASRFRHVNRLVTLGHDGGFFSIFNAFISHAVWGQREDRCHAVLPDWDVGRMLAAQGSKPMLSFCYGRPEDGNIWCRLFEPIFGFSAAEMNDPDILYERATRPTYVHNELCEPKMTYVHAYKLYGSPEFSAWRRQYHDVFARHVRPRADLLADIESFAARHFEGRLAIAAHVRHPSHTVEQPGAVIAHEDAYIAQIYKTLAEHGLSPNDDGFTIFLATDQERVVSRFRHIFGERVACLSGVRRTSDAEDAAYGVLSEKEKHGDGHQLQHLVAANRSAWSLSMAEEVIRDAWLMARCNVLLHVVSNVSTAASYINPDLEMVFCKAA